MFANASRHPGPAPQAPEPGFLVAADGARLALRHWPVEGPRLGVVAISHGLGEHGGRYVRLARLLNAQGLDVLAMDHYGHGDSDGARGCITHPLRLLEDLDLLIACARERAGPAPVFLLGHSMGGLVAARWVMAAHPGRLAIDGLILSSPALAADLAPVQRLMLRVLPPLLPDLAVGNGLDPQGLSHDPQVVRDYLADPKVHDRISGRLARFIVDEGLKVRAAASRWAVPTLLMWAGSDRLVAPVGSEAFAQAAPAGVVTARGFSGLYHEIFNELDPAPVDATLLAWLRSRLQPALVPAGAPAR